MQVKMKKLAIMLLVGCLMLVAISAVSAVDVGTFDEMKTEIGNGNNVTLSQNIEGLGSVGTDGIVISRNTTVDGDGHYIDAQGNGRFFKITNGNAVLTLKNITLKNGKVGSNGGAIYGDGNVNIIVNGNVCFNNNNATGSGGAIYSGGMVNITSQNGAIIFENNNATSTSSFGGAIFTKNDVIIDFYGDVCFNYNTASNGGAIYSYGLVNITSRDGVVTFENNNVPNVNGGAIRANGNVTITATNGDVTFKNNKAGCGGAICAINVNITSVDGDIIFENNTSIAGGAIDAYDNEYVSIIALTGTIRFNNNNKAINNGGAILEEKEGAIVILKGKEIIFNNNTATSDDGGAIRAFGEVTIKAEENIIFTDNFANSTGTNNQGGAGISAYELLNGNPVFYNVTLTSENGNIIFRNNTAGKNGGAILGKNINITANNVEFTNNKAFENDGGAIRAFGEVTIKASEDIIFNDNFAKSNETNDQGGAGISAYKYLGGINFEYYNVTLTSTNGKIVFRNNTAGKDGGAIFGGNVSITANNIEFSNNEAFIRGGAIGANGIVTITTTNGNVTFYNNSVTNYAGGAIFAGRNVVINATGIVTFYNNNAIAGGAIAVSNNVVINSTDGVIFYNNNCTDAELGTGGAIYAYANVTITTTNGDVTFYNNNVNGPYGGGAICANTGNVTITTTNGDVTFYNNNATSNGGAICANTGNVTITTTNGDVTFYNNSAIGGGAIYAKCNIDINIGSDVTFYNNSAIGGGAICAQGNININIIDGNVIFYNNTANGTYSSGYGGGAIYTIGNININAIDGDVIFYNNNATAGMGGAIFAFKDVYITTTNGSVNFYNNTAFGAGAISTTKDVYITTTNGSVNFYNNVAFSGGAIGAGNNVVINCTDGVSFYNNTATIGGAIYSGGNVNITNAVFYGNNATNGTVIVLKNWTNSNLTYNYWGLNYQNKTSIINAGLIATINDDGEIIGTVAPDNWILLNITTPTKIVTEENNTFQSKFNILTNGTTNSTYNNFNGTMLVKLNSTLSNSISYVIVGKPFNMTFDKEGNYKLDIINIYTNQTIIETSFKVDANIRTFKDLQKLIDNNTELVLKDNYTFVNSKDSGSLIINKKILIDGNGTTINGNSNVIFRITKNGNLTLKNINLINTKVCIVNDGFLNVNNVKSTGSIINNGIITSGVKFMVINSKVTTYDSFLVSLRTDNGIPIAVNSLKFTDDQGHNYESYIYYNGYYVNYVPESIVGHVTFNNSTVNNFNNLTTKGSLDITKYSKTSSNIVKSVSTKIINNIVKTTPNDIINSPIVKNINHIVKNTVKDIKTNIFKILRA